MDTSKFVMGEARDPVLDLLHMQRVVAGQHNTLLSQREVMRAELIALRHELETLNNAIMNEAHLSDDNRSILQTHLQKIIDRHFAETQDEAHQINDQAAGPAVFEGDQGTSQVDLLKRLLAQREAELREARLQGSADPNISEESAARIIATQESPARILARDDSLVQKLRKQIEDLEDAVVQKNKQITGLQTASQKLGDAESDLVSAEAKIKDLRRRLLESEVLVAEKTNLEYRMADTQQELNQANDKVKRLEAQLSASSSSPSQQLEGLRQELNTAHDELSQLQDRLRLQERTLAEKEDKIRQLNSKISKLESTIASHEANLKAAGKFESKPVLDNDRVRGLQVDPIQTDGTQARPRSDEERVALLETEVYSLRSRLTAAEQAIRTKDEIIASSFDGANRPDKVESLLKASTEALKNYQQNTLEVDSLTAERDRLELEVNKAKSNQRMIDDELASKERKLNDLKQSGASTMEIAKVSTEIDDLVQSKNNAKNQVDQADRLLQNKKDQVAAKTVEVEDLKDYLKAMQAQMQTSQSISSLTLDVLQRLEKEVSKISNIIGSSPTKASSSLDRPKTSSATSAGQHGDNASENESFKLREKLNEKTSRVTQLEGQLDDVRRQLTGTQAELEQAERRISMISQNRPTGPIESSSLGGQTTSNELKDLNELKSRNRLLEGEVATLSQECSDLRNQVRQLTASDRDSLQGQTKRESQQIERLRSEVADRKTDIDQLQADLRLKTETTDKLKTELSNLRFDLQSKTEELERSTRKFTTSEQRLRQEVESVKEDMDKYITDIRQQTHENRDLTKKLQISLVENKRQVEEYDQVRGEATETKRLLDASNSKAKLLINELTQAKITIDDLTAKATSLAQGSDKGFDKSDASLINKIRSRYEEELQIAGAENETLRRKFKEKQQEVMDLELVVERARSNKTKDIDNEADLQLVQQRQADLQSQLKKAQDEINELKATTSQKERQISNLEHELADARQLQLRAPAETSPSQSSSSSLLIERLKLQITETERDKAFEIGRLKQQLEGISKELVEQTAENSALNKKIRERQQELFDLKMTIDQLSFKAAKEVKDRDDQIEELRERLKSSTLRQPTAQQSPVKSQVAEGSEEDHAGETMKRWNDQLQQMREQLDDTQDELSKMRRLIKQKDQQVGELLDKLEQQAEAERRAAANKEKDDEIDRLSDKAAKLSRKIDELTDERNKAQHLAETLENSESDKLAVMRQKLNHANSEINELVKREDELVSELSKAKRDLGEIEVLKDRIISKDKRLAEAAVEIAELDTRVGALRKTAGELEVANERLTIASKRISEISTEKDKLDEQVSALKRQQREQDPSIDEKLSTLTKRFEDIRAERDLFRDQIAELKSTKDDLQLIEAKLQASQKRFVDLTKERDELVVSLNTERRLRADEELKVERVEKRLVELMKDWNNLTKDVSKDKDTERKLLTLEEENSHLSRMVEKLRAQVTDAEGENQVLTKRIREKIVETVERPPITVDEVERLRNIIRHKEGEIDELVVKIDDSKKAQNRLLDEASDQEAKLKRRVHELENQLVEIESKPARGDQDRFKQIISELTDSNNQLMVKLREKQAQMIKTVESKDEQIEQLQVNHQERHISSQRKLQEVINRHDEIQSELREARGALNDIKQMLNEPSLADRKIPSRIGDILSDLDKSKPRIQSLELEIEGMKQPRSTDIKTSSEIRNLRESILRKEEEKFTLERRVSQLEKWQAEAHDMKAKLAEAQEAQAAAEKISKERQRAIDGLIDDTIIGSLLRETREMHNFETKTQAVEVLPDILRRFLRKEKSEKDFLKVKVEEYERVAEQTKAAQPRLTPANDPGVLEALEKEVVRKTEEAAKYRSDLRLIENKYEDLVNELRRTREGDDIEELKDENVRLMEMVESERRKGEVARLKTSKLRDDISVLESRLTEAGGVQQSMVAVAPDDLQQLQSELTRTRKNVGSMQQRINELQAENDELNANFDKNLDIMKAKYNRMRDRLADQEEAHRMADSESIDIIKHRMGEMVTLINELKANNMVLEDARRQDLARNRDFRNKEENIRAIEERLDAQRQRLQEKERQVLSRASNEKEHDRRSPDVQVKDVEQILSREVLAEFMSLERDNSQMNKLMRQLRAAKSASKIVDELGKAVITLNHELRQSEEVSHSAKNRLDATVKKYAVVKETLIRVEQENKKLYEELNAADRRNKQAAGKDTDEQELTIRDLMLEIKRLQETIFDLKGEKDELANKVKEMSKIAERSDGLSPAGPTRKSRSQLSVVEADKVEIRKQTIEEVVIETGPGRGMARSRSPMMVDVYIEEEQERHINMQVREVHHHREASKSRGRRDDSLQDKENNVSGSNRGIGSPTIDPRLRKFVGAWNQVVELIESFEQVIRDFDKINTQIQKDRTRMEHLSIKKPDLAPYLREITKILSSPPVEQLAKNKRELQESETEYLTKSIGYFEKLCEEFGYVYGTFAERLKGKKTEYVRWNKKLAAYCQKHYPQFSN